MINIINKNNIKQALLALLTTSLVCACNDSSLQIHAENNPNEEQATQVVLLGALKSKTFPINELYHQESPEPTWQQVLDSGNLNPLESHTHRGFKGSIVTINNAIIEVGTYGNNPINAKERGMFIHTVGNPKIAYSAFHKWSRWYQEDGNTQIFRLYKNEENVSNTRKKAARIEAFIPSATWMPEPDVWREFGARFTVIKSAGCSGVNHCSIFQAKGNNVDHFSVMLRVDDKGNLWYSPRGKKKIPNSKDMTLIDSNIIGKPFDLKIRDNGLDYQMYIDEQLVGQGQWPRTLQIGFRWGIYTGNSDLTDDVILLVTGATMK